MNSQSRGIELHCMGGLTGQFKNPFWPVRHAARIANCVMIAADEDDSDAFAHQTLKEALDPQTRPCIAHRTIKKISRDDQCSHFLLDGNLNDAFERTAASTMQLACRDFIQVPQTAKRAVQVHVRSVQKSNPTHHCFRVEEIQPARFVL